MTKTRVPAQRSAGSKTTSPPRAEAAGVDPETRAELCSVVSGLQSLRDRIQQTVGVLERRACRAEGAEAIRAVYLVQCQLWGFAGELIGSQLRLRWLAEDLARVGQPASPREAEGEVLGEPAELLAVLQCVLADRLGPAVEALVGACQPSGAA